MTIFLFVIFSIFIIMKKIVRLTEADLTRIVKRVIQEEQLNEGIKLKSLLPAIAIVASLNLSSCKSKSEFEDKIPDLETLVLNQINRADKFYKESTDQNDGYPDAIEFKKIVSVKGPFTTCKSCPNTYYIIVNVNEIINGQNQNNFYVDIYQEGKDGKGKIVGVGSSVPSIKEANHQIDYMKKYERWDRYSNYSDYMNRLDYAKISLESMENEFSGRYDELEISSDRYNQPSDYYEEIDLHSEELNNIKEDSKEDLKSNNINKREYDIIIKEVNSLLKKLEDFKYTIR